MFDRILTHDEVLHGEHIEQGVTYIRALESVIRLQHIKNFEKEACDAIKLVFNEYFSFYLKSAGLGSFTIDPKPKQGKEKLLATIEWMITYIKESLVPYIGTYCLLPEEQWKNYEMFKLNDVDEVIQLKPLKQKLIKDWKKRPGAIKRIYRHE